MKYFIPQDIVITDSDIGIYENADGTINAPWSKSEKINGAGAIRQTNHKIYESQRKLEDLVTYIWHDADPLSRYAIKTSDDTTSNGTAIPIVNGLTTVYVISNEKYYIAKTTGTINFTTEDYLTPANFNEVTDSSLRYKYFDPENREESSLYWSYKGVSNYKSSTSKAINKYTTKNTNTFYQEFVTSGANICVLYNVVATDITVEIRNNDTDEVLQIIEEDGVDLTFTSFREWFDSSIQPTNYKTKIVMTPEFYHLGEIKVRITLSNTLENPKLGEIFIGSLSDGGNTLDGVDTPTQTDSEIIKNEAGEQIFDGEGDMTRVYRTMRMDIKIPTSSYDLYSDMTARIINQRIVVIGENTDEPTYQSLILFGGVTTATPKLTSNSTHSSLQCEIREFI